MIINRRRLLVGFAGGVLAPRASRAIAARKPSPPHWAAHTGVAGRTATKTETSSFVIEAHPETDFYTVIAGLFYQ
jgi:hypothetical protein